MYVVLALTALTVTVQNILKQRFNERCKNGAYLFSAMAAFVAMLVFLCSNREWTWDGALWLPTVGFALAYAAATVFSVLAILHGPLAKTSLIISCSLLIPSLYGILVQGLLLQRTSVGEALSPTLLGGTVLLFVSLFLVNRPSAGQGRGQRATLRWAIFALLAFLGNGFCSVVQAAKQDFCGNERNGIFMIAALLLASFMLLAAALLVPSQRAAAGETLKKGWLLALLCGAANGVTNLFVIYLNASGFPASITFPVISGGGILLVFLYSLLVKRERYTTPQYVGYALGVISIVLLNI